MNGDGLIAAMSGRLDVPSNEDERQYLRRLIALDLSPIGLCPDCRGAIFRHGTATVDEAIRYHQSKEGGCAARIAAHLGAARPAAAVATMRYLHLKVEADDVTSAEQHRLRDRITEGIPHFEETTWTLVYDLFGSPYESEEEWV